jgi:two-component system OmpR family response regulator
MLIPPVAIGSTTMDRFNSKISAAMTGAPRVLLVEDDSDISRMLVETLKEHGYAAVSAASAEEMDKLFERKSPDLVILDVMLPGEGGLDICRRLRAASNIPIIMLTALGSEIDRVLGLEIGADDYVTKPFGSRELIARVRALLRRSQIDQARVKPLSKIKAFQFAGWRLEPSSRQLINPEDVRVSLTSTEFDLLLGFCQNPGRILSRDQLLDLTHSGSAGPMGRSIDVHVSRVRQKLENDSPEVELIKTVRLGGYIFTSHVEVS